MDLIAVVDNSIAVLMVMLMLLDFQAFILNVNESKDSMLWKLWNRPLTMLMELMMPQLCSIGRMEKGG